MICQSRCASCLVQRAAAQHGPFTSSRRNNFLFCGHNFGFVCLFFSSSLLNDNHVFDFHFLFWRKKAARSCHQQKCLFYIRMMTVIVRQVQGRCIRPVNGQFVSRKILTCSPQSLGQLNAEWPEVRA